MKDLWTSVSSNSKALGHLNLDYGWMGGCLPTYHIPLAILWCQVSPSTSVRSINNIVTGSIVTSCFLFVDCWWIHLNSLFLSVLSPPASLIKLPIYIRGMVLLINLLGPSLLRYNWVSGTAPLFLSPTTSSISPAVQTPIAHAHQILWFYSVAKNQNISPTTSSVSPAVQTQYPILSPRPTKSPVLWCYRKVNNI